MIVDRALQAQVLNALEPEWEARFEPKSYGFRPGRGCHDAIESIYNTVMWQSPHGGCGCSTLIWQRRSTASTTPIFSVLSAVSLRRGSSSVGSKRGHRQTVASLQPRREPPKVGSISPLLLNVALHGMEEAAGVRYLKSGVQCRVAGGGLSSGGALRRRPCGAVPQSGRGRRGQGPAGGVVGAEGSGLQRGQDEDRPPRRGLRLLGLPRPAPSRTSC